MCGIAGALELDPRRPPSAEGLRRMGAVLCHRGPDEEGFYASGPLGFAHRRLSIIDLASGQQPMTDADGDVCVTYNGEIYNYRELRADLERHGHRFRTTSDTEVLVALYRQYGLDAFPRLNGMFACAFWDRRSAQLVLARDRFGKKPLYYYQDGHRVLFGSEVKALLAFGGVERSVNLRALHEYLTHSYIVGDEAIVSGVRRVPPAHVVVVERGRVTTRRYWRFAFRPATPAPSEAEAVETTRTLLQDAVSRRLMSEVPLGAFLSGGLDSSTVVAFMARLSSRPVQTFSVGFDEEEYSELADARRVARHLGTDHHEMIIKPASLDVLSDLVWHLDEPFGDSSALATYYVCQAARQHVTVALSGDGGDEVFAGYTRYQELDGWRRWHRIPRWIRGGVLERASRALPFTWPGWNSLYAAGRLGDPAAPPLLGIYPWIQEHLYSRDFKAAVANDDAFATTRGLVRDAAHLDPVSRAQHLDTLEYLPADILVKVDRMSMAHSLEVRAPLLDYTLVEYVATLPAAYKLGGGVTKRILRQAAAPLLPPAVLTKPKQGFGVPKDLWFKNELRSFAADILLDRRSLARGWIRRDTLVRMLAHHAGGRRDYSTWIWCLLVLETWCRLFLDAAAQPAAAAPARSA